MAAAIRSKHCAILPRRFTSTARSARTSPPVAVSQLELALRLPIALGGALMPDAHVGYALPIGGVFAAHRAVSPAMVGVDIGCRMHLSLFDIAPRTRSGCGANRCSATYWL